MKTFKTLLASHAAGMLLCLLMLFVMPSGWHLRWNTGYFIVYATMLSGVCAMALSFVKRTEVLLRLYLVVFSLAAVFMIIHPMARDIFLTPDVNYGGEKGFIVKKEKAVFVDPSVIVLYKTTGLFEKRVRTLYRGIFVEDITDITVNTDWSFIMMKEYSSGEGYISSSKCLFPIDRRIFRKHLRAIREMARRDSVEVIEL